MNADLRYAIWNNKGGVGKTFLTFVIASEYASNNPQKNVVIIDMCPQANVSEIILGGNGAGAGNLDSLLKASPNRISIGGYFDQRIENPHSKTGTETSFLQHAHKYNPNIPKNLMIIAGDPSLEIQSQSINQIAAQTLPKSAWLNVHKWVLDLVTSIKVQIPNSVFFIDCNPSFSAYTEIALAAANRLIVPCTADGSSARAIDNLGQLLYGINVPPVYSGVNLAERAEKAGLSLPSIHLVPLNRSTQFDNSASKAFGAMYKEVKKRVETLNKIRPDVFSQNINDVFIDIPDTHSVSVVASHKGIPLGQIRTTKYDIHGISTQVNPEPLNRYKTALNDLVSRL